MVAKRFSSKNTELVKSSPYFVMKTTEKASKISLAFNKKSNDTLFADNTSLFSVVLDPLETEKTLNKDLERI